MTHAGVDVLLRELAPQVVGAVARRFRDVHGAEDAFQEALLVAASRWPDEGLPDDPRGWLITVAARRMNDGLRRETARRRREVTAASSEVNGATPASDDSLTLLFLCCHRR